MAPYHVFIPVGIIAIIAFINLRGVGDSIDALPVLLKALVSLAPLS
jgi:hypothetical protein